MLQHSGLSEILRALLRASRSTITSIHILEIASMETRSPFTQTPLNISSPATVAWARWPWDVRIQSIETELAFTPRLKLNVRCLLAQGSCQSRSKGSGLKRLRFRLRCEYISTLALTILSHPGHIIQRCRILLASPCD